MIKVKIHTVSVLARIVGQRELEASLPEGSTLKTLISWMKVTWGEKISAYLVRPDNAGPLPHIRFLVNGQDIGFLNGMETVLGDGDEVLMIPPVAVVPTSGLRSRSIMSASCSPTLASLIPKHCSRASCTPTSPICAFTAGATAALNIACISEGTPGSTNSSTSPW